jgi:DNA-binding transcriptional MerR regulator
MDVDYELKALCELAGVTPRTVYYYVQLGLLPGAGSVGPGARYGQGHLARLRLIRLLQQQHLPLGEIRQRLETLNDGQAEALLREIEARKEPPPTSAADYIREVLQGRAPRNSAGAQQQWARRPTQTGPSVADRSHWERVTLSPDVELHIRRPLAREMNRRIDQLIQQARDILREDSYDD